MKGKRQAGIRQHEEKYAEIDDIEETVKSFHKNQGTRQVIDDGIEFDTQVYRIRQTVVRIAWSQNYGAAGEANGLHE